jgi:hypothetical protein
MMDEWIGEISRLRQQVESGQIKSRADLAKVQDDLRGLRKRLVAEPGFERTLLWLDAAILHVSEMLAQPEEISLG